MITTILFDLDGTLLNTLDDIWASVNYSLAQNGYPLRSKEEIRSYLGNGAKVLIEKSLPSESRKEAAEKVLNIFRSFYLPHAMDTTSPYQGVPDLLRALKKRGYKTAIVSNKPDTAVQELYQTFFASLIDVAIGELPEIRRKPCPDMLLKAMSQLGSTSEECIYVGDSEVDYQTACNIGLPCVSVSWGFRNRSYLESIGASPIIDSPDELLSLIP